LPPLRLADKRWERATLRDFELRFDCFSKSRNCGAANVVPVLGKYVCGVVFDVDQEEFAVVARKEGAPHTYVEQCVELSLPEDSRISAITFRCRPGTERPQLCPSRAYLDLIREGAINYGMDAAWIETLTAITAQ